MHDLTELSPFERRLSETMREHVAGVGDPRPIAEIAAVAMGARRDPAQRLGGWLHWSDAGVPVAWRPILAVALLAIALVVAALVVGSRQNAPLSSNGAIAYPAEVGVGDSMDVLGLIAPEGANATLPSDPGRSVECPTWSPDGSSLAYISTTTLRDQSGASPGVNGDIVVADADGGGTRIVQPHEGLNSPTSIAWSPSGAWIAYHLAGEIRITPVRGGPSRSIAPGLELFGSAPWSPDGGRLAIEVYVGGQTKLETVSIDGGDTRVLANVDQSITGNSQFAGFAWSPDGTAIAYVSGDRLWVIPADGSGTPTDVTGEAPSALTPSWSPDSQQIAFIDNDQWTGDFTSRVWLVDRNGSHSRIVSTLPAGTGLDLVTWSPDGRQLVVDVKHELTYRLVQLSIDGGPPRELISFRGWGAMEAIVTCPVSWRRLPTP